MMPKIQDFDEELLDLARMIKCLAHPARISILREVARRGECGPEDDLQIQQLSPLTIKQHLREMKKAGLVSGRIFGKNSCYTINWERFTRFRSQLEEYFEEMVDLREFYYDET